MKGDGEVKISYLATHFTTTVSVTLVLLLVGIIAMITISSRRETKRIREQLEVSLIMKDSVSDAQASEIASFIAGKPYALETGYIGKERALREWKDETGEDLETLFGVNPLSPEVYFRIKADYSSQDSLNIIRKELQAMPSVADVAMPDSEMVEAMNDNIENLAIILGVIAAVMIVISFVLINNTVHLSIYSRRFTIHTMQLVGATNGFIRRPFIVNNMMAGLMAGIVASGVTAVALAAAPHMGWNDVADYISWGLYACVAGGMLLGGTLICAMAAWLATGRYLRKDYDELFR